MKVKSSIIIFALLSLAAFTSIAQRRTEIGLSLGAVNYIGDLANEPFFPYSSVSSGAALTFRDFAGRPNNRYKTVDLQVRLSWHRLQYDETKSIAGKEGTELRNYLRGLNFRNDLFGCETGITYNFYLNRNQPLWKPSFSFFLSAGVGVFYGVPRADLFRGDLSMENRYHFWSDGTVRNLPENPQGIGDVIGKDRVYETVLNDWNTEGQGFEKEIHRKAPYSNWHIGIPLGTGVRYVFNKQFTVSAEVNYYYFFSDYLDDASDRYATYEELRAAFPDEARFELAKYISDPTGKGTNGFAGPATSPRGNPGLTDAFTFFSMEASYKFSWKKKSVYGQFTSR